MPLFIIINDKYVFFNKKSPMRNIGLFWDQAVSSIAN